MFHKAFEILNSLQLDHMRMYHINDIARLPEDRHIFLRYCKNRKNNNRIIKVKDFMSNYDFYSKDVLSNNIVQIADAIKSDAGCSLYFGEDYVYGEYVEGEPITLLRRGICGKRFLIDLTNNNVLYKKTSFQNWICSNEEGRYHWMPYNGVISNHFDLAISEVLRVVNINKSGLLFETHIEQGRLIFSDAKTIDLGFELKKLCSLFNSNGIVQLKGILDINQAQIDSLDVDNPSDFRKSLLLYNGALLSHYVTYNIDALCNIAVLVR